MASHSAEELQLVGHAAAPLHTYGAQLGTPAVPAATGPQIPGRPGRSQRSHAPVQALSQHTPSTHSPPSHWVDAVQAEPFGRSGAHAPSVQLAPGAQSVFEVQLVRQAPFGPQRYTPHAGSAERSGADSQVPALGPLQVRHGPLHAESQQVPSTQFAVRHWFPAAHAVPAASFGWQAPVGSSYSFAGHPEHTPAAQVCPPGHDTPTQARSTQTP